MLERLLTGRERLSVERVRVRARPRRCLSRAGASWRADGRSRCRLPRWCSGRSPRTIRSHARRVERFATWLGRFAGDAALFFGARGGVYLGGGIAPRMVDVLSAGPFRRAFEAKGRMAAYLAPIPAYVILAGDAALRGAAAALTAHMTEPS